jgi:hypothetical protein
VALSRGVCCLGTLTRYQSVFPDGPIDLSRPAQQDPESIGRLGAMRQVTPSRLFSTPSPWRTATCCLRRIVVTHISARLRTIYRLLLVSRPPRSQQPVVVGRLTGIESQTRGVERVPGRPGLCISKTPVTPRTIRSAARFRAAKQFRIAAVPHDCHCLIYPCCPILRGSRGGCPATGLGVMVGCRCRRASTVPPWDHVSRIRARWSRPKEAKWL